jgi:hypothetical protein
MVVRREEVFKLDLTVPGLYFADVDPDFSLSFTAQNGIGSPATQPFTLTVNQAPAITSANNVTFVVGTSASFTVTTTGNPNPSIGETGALPSGVTFVDNGNGTGKLSGTPAAGTGGVYSISFKAQNGIGSPATQPFTLTVNQAPAITSANNAGFTVGAAGSFTVTTTGFPTPGITETGALPGGVTSHDNGNGTGTLSGTPTSNGCHSPKLRTRRFNKANRFIPRKKFGESQRFSPAVSKSTLIKAAPHGRSTLQ